jgi:VWFA-related protein
VTNDARTLVAIGLIAVLCTSVTARQALGVPEKRQQPAPQQPRPVFETRADIVLVDVNVVSGNGEPVEGLTAADFVLTVNGQQRVVNSAQFISARGSTTVAEPERLAGVSSNDRETTGRALLFVVDENYLRAGAHRAVLKTAERVMERLLPGDLVGLARLPTGRGGVEFTTDRARIRRALNASMGQQPSRQQERVRLSEAAAYERNDQTVWRQVILRECNVGDSMIAVAGAGAGSFEQNACIKDIEAQAKYVVNDASARTRVSIGAFEGLAERLATIKVPVNIVLISEGLFIGRDRDDLGHLARLAARARISFFVVQPDDSMFDMDVPKIFTTARDDTLMSEGLEQLAGFTRGSYYRVSTTGAGIFERIGRELSGYYLLSFEPTDADRTSRDRRIRVEVKRRGLTVRARSTFALNEDAAPAVPLAPSDQIKQLLSAPLPTPGLPMRVASYRVTNAGDAKVRVIVSAEIGDAATEQAEWPVGLYLIDQDDRVVANMITPMTLAPATDRTSSPRLLITSFLVEPGDYTLRLAAVGPDGVSGSVHHLIEARLSPLGRESLRASDLVLTSDNGPGAAPRPVPSGIVYSETMAAMLELAGEDAVRLNGAKVTVHVSESEASPPLVTVDAQAAPRAAGQRMFVAPLKLAVLPPGEYVARAVVAIPGEPDTEVVRAFRLAPVATAADASPIAARVADEAAPVPPPVARIVAPVVRFSVDDVLEPGIVRGFLDALQRTHPVSAASAPIVQRARNGEFVITPSDGSASAGDEPTLSFIRGLAQLEKQQYAQAAAWFQLSLKEASDFLGAAFYLGAVHAASGRDHDAVGAWQMSIIGDGGAAAYPLLVDGLLRIGDGQAAIDLIAEAPDAWPSDRARRRRVATAQAMIGQFEPALEILHALLTEQPNDVDLLYVTLQVLYRQHLARPLDAAERTRFGQYADRYAAAGGPEAALVNTWRRFVER